MELADICLTARLEIQPWNDDVLQPKPEKVWPTLLSLNILLASRLMTSTTYQSRTPSFAVFAQSPNSSIVGSRSGVWKLGVLWEYPRRSAVTTLTQSP